MLFNRFVDESLIRIRKDRANAPLPSERAAAKVHAELIGGWEIEDWKNPDYGDCMAFRAEVLSKIRKDPGLILPLKQHYKLNPADFINDWGYTTDPRNAEVGLPVKVPFILFEKQREWIDWVVDHWHNQRPGLSEKSRDCGLSWLAIGLGCTLCLHYTGLNIGYGSRKAEYVDKKGAPKSLFWKARKFMDNLPQEFNGGWNPDQDAPAMRLSFRETESTMSGEGGDSIGRGDRASIYFVDEAAWLEQPEETDAALSQTTNCQMDISSVHGAGNPFARKRFSGKVDVFVFDWRDDPRKDDAWYQKEVDRLDETVVAQEIDRNYYASVDKVVIPSAHVRAAIDAHLKLKVEITGARTGALDVADEGKDKNGFCGGKGILVDVLEEWSGKASDIFATVERALQLCDDSEITRLRYDADGLGASVRGDARVLNEIRRRDNKREIQALAYRGSEKVYMPEVKSPGENAINKERFENHKAQSWWNARRLFKNTYRAVVEGAKFDPNEIISISSGCKNYLKLVTELSQPIWKENNPGKLIIDKAPDGARSPNLADALVIKFAPMATPLLITEEVIGKSRMPTSASRGAQRPTGRAYGSRIVR